MRSALEAACDEITNLRRELVALRARADAAEAELEPLRDWAAKARLRINELERHHVPKSPWSSPAEIDAELTRLEERTASRQSPAPDPAAAAAEIVDWLCGDLPAPVRQSHINGVESRLREIAGPAQAPPAPESKP